MLFKGPRNAVDCQSCFEFLLKTGDNDHTAEMSEGGWEWLASDISTSRNLSLQQRTYERGIRHYRAVEGEPMVSMNKGEIGILILAVFAGLLLTSCNLPIEGLLPSTEIPPSTNTPIQLPPETSSTISGLIWHDLCAVPGEGQPIPEEPPAGCVQLDDGSYKANGIREADEPGIENVLATLGTGPCPSSDLATAVTDVNGFFSFADLDAGSYCLMVDPSHPQNASVLIPGWWTTEPVDASGRIAMEIDLASGEMVDSLEFGWDYQFLPPYEPPATETPSPTETPTEAAEATPTPTPTATATQIPAASELPSGEPYWRDTFDNATNWPLDGNKWETEQVRFEIKEGKMFMTAFNPDYFEGWVLSWPQLTDFYLEGIFSVGNCAGGDRYGLFARGTVPEDENPVGYLFGITCDGRYSLRTWDGEEFTFLISWTSSDLISAGSNKTHRLGFLAEGDNIGLYVDKKKVAEFVDDTFTSGKFGLFIGSVETENFTTTVDEIAYWLLQ
ncbi:MAG: hypothetical protein GTO18_09225 [Anaerolineales bacterium]|nr:hypothetical protein [Anaerolineales bacterium]